MKPDKSNVHQENETDYEAILDELDEPTPEEMDAALTDLVDRTHYLPPGWKERSPEPSGDEPDS